MSRLRVAPEVPEVVAATPTDVPPPPDKGLTTVEREVWLELAPQVSARKVYDPTLFTSFRLLVQSVAVLIVSTVVLWLILFLVAGTPHYWQAWVFAPVFTLSTSLYGLYFSIKDPALIERRKQAGRKQDGKYAGVRSSVLHEP